MNVTKALDLIKKYWAIALVLAGVLAIGYVGYGCGQRSRANEVSDLTTKLAESEKTNQIKDDLYATTILELDDTKKILDTSRTEVATLKKTLDDMQAQLLTTQQVAVKWKNAYEAELSAHQSDGGSGSGSDGNPVERKRVDFSGDLGPIHAEGHTLTDPAEAHLKLSQIRPLILTVSVARNQDGKWQSFVTSSEPNMSVDVNLAAVDPGVISPTWKQRIWLTGGVDFLMGERASLGLSYQFDRVSLGADCSAWVNGHGCGLTVGYRLFK